MKKAFAAVMCLLLLSGCISQADLPQRVLEQLTTFAKETGTVGINRRKGYYSYYLPQGVGQRDANELSEVLVKDGYRVVMNFDPSSIVIKNYYGDTEETDETTKTDTAKAPQKQDVLKQVELMEPTMDKQPTKIVYRGNYLNATQEVLPYTLQLMASNGYYLVYLDGALIKLYAYVPGGEISAVLRAMLTLMISVEYHETKILKDYSLKSIPQTKKKNLDYLEKNIPSSGSLGELLEGDDSNTVPQGDATSEEEQ